MSAMGSTAPAPPRAPALGLIGQLIYALTSGGGVRKGLRQLVASAAIATGVANVAPSPEAIALTGGGFVVLLVEALVEHLS